MEELAFAGLARQAELVRLGEVSARELAALHIERIARLDPALNAFRVVLAERALAEAAAADARRGEDAPPLNGVPVAIKDDTDVAGVPTGLGSLAADGPAPADAEIVRRLRAAGAVVVGKTNVPELAALPVTESLAAGASRNPWDVARTPGGSSGGSGAAVAAGLAAAALGTDGAGSIRIPAGCCGVFGLKPQRGRLPMRPAWNGLTVAGPITRGVLDAALFCDAVLGDGDAFAAAARRPPGRLRVAVSFKLPPGVSTRLHAEPREAVERTAERLRDLGHEVIERDPHYGPAASAVVTRYLDGLRREAELLPHPERLARRTRGLVAMGRVLPAQAVRRALAREEADRRRIGGLFERHDVLLTPLFPRRPFAVGELDGLPAPVVFVRAANFVAYLGAWNHLGHPAAALPVEQAPDGFPVGVQVVGRARDETTLLSLAAQLEEATGWTARRPPDVA